MKKVIALISFCAIFSQGFAQQTAKAIFRSGTDIQIGDFNPSTGSISNKVMTFSQNTNLNNFIFDSKNGKAIIHDIAFGLVFCNLSNSTGKIQNSLPANTIMAPAYIPSTEKLMCFNVQKEFNGYGNNEDNLFFSSINVNQGVIENFIKIPDLSFDNVSAPFYGKISVLDRFTQKNIEKEVAISKSVYLPEKNLYMVMARDVTGTNRLYKINVTSSNSSAYSSERCEYNILDMAPILGTDYVKVLFFNKSGSTYNLNIGDMHIETNVMNHVNHVSTFTASQISSGSIQFNTDQSQLFVSIFNYPKTSIYSINANDNQIISSVSYAGEVEFDFGFNDVYYKTQTMADLIGFYPNPSTGLLNFKNNTGYIPNTIKVYNSIGQLIRSIKVEELTAEIQLDLSDLATGLYHVKVDMQGEDYLGKIAITH